jgi:hypothetical protein
MVMQRHTHAVFKLAIMNMLSQKIIVYVRPMLKKAECFNFPIFEDVSTTFQFDLVFRIWTVEGVWMILDAFLMVFEALNRF